MLSRSIGRSRFTPLSLAHTSPTGISGYGRACPGHWGGWAGRVREHGNLSSGTRPNFGEENSEAEAEGASINGGVMDFSHTPLDIPGDSSGSHSSLLGFLASHCRVGCGLPLWASSSAASSCNLET